jgi:hypothetical protein
MHVVPRGLRALLTCLSLSAPLSACSVSRVHQVERASATGLATEQIVGVTMVGGQEAMFDAPGARVQGDTLVAQIRGTPFRILIDQVDRVWLRRKQRSAMATLGGVAFSLAIPVAVVGLSFLLGSTIE